MELMRLIDKHDREVNESTLHSLLSLVVPCTKTLHMLADCYAMSFWQQPAVTSDNWTDAKKCFIPPGHSSFDRVDTDSMNYASDAPIRTTACTRPIFTVAYPE
jgi:hypothetical protein